MANQRPRISIGVLMLFIAGSAVIFAPSARRDQFPEIYITYALLGMVGFGVSLFNRRLSRWLDVVIVGQLLAPLMELAGDWIPVRLQWPWDILLRGVPAYLLTLIGTAMTYRAARRRLATLEARVALLEGDAMTHLEPAASRPLIRSGEAGA